MAQLITNIMTGVGVGGGGVQQTHLLLLLGGDYRHIDPLLVQLVTGAEVGWGAGYGRPTAGAAHDRCGGWQEVGQQTLSHASCDHICPDTGPCACMPCHSCTYA